MDTIKLAKGVMDACMKKDEGSIRKFVDASYTLTDPMMAIEGVDALLEMVKSCPDGASVSNLDYIAQGDRVVATFDNNFGGDVMRMCSIMTFKDGKLQSEEMFYDTAKIPQYMKSQLPNKKSA